jgi:hypothetical protein
VQESCSLPPLERVPTWPRETESEAPSESVLARLCLPWPVRALPQVSLQASILVQIFRPGSPVSPESLMRLPPEQQRTRS